jgi:acyl-CoA dehydrogenase
VTEDNLRRQFSKGGFGVISFRLTEKDREILAEARQQAELAVKYARDFEKDEDRLVPDCYPEATNRPDVHALIDKHEHDISGRKIMEALLYLEEWYGGVPLRTNKYSLGNTVLRIAGTPAQMQRWQNKIIAIALTEPGGGSDPAATRTTARYDAETNEWILNGEKIFISYAEGSEASLVLARVVHPDRPRALSTFLVERGTNGFTVSRQLRKMGIRWEDTANLSFSDCRIPSFNHIDGDFKNTMQSFSESRPIVSSFALGVSRAALDFTWRKLEEFGIKPDYNATSLAQTAAADRLIRLEADWEATWLTVVRAKWLEQIEGPGKIESAMAKAMAGRLSRRVTQSCIDILGQTCLSEDFDLEKRFRDGRIFDIYEGTGDMQRLIIARHLLGYSPKDLN